MTLSINCKDAGDPVCTHTMYGETEEQLFENAKKHGMEVHGFTEEKWNEEVSKNKDHYRKLIKTIKPKLFPLISLFLKTQLLYSEI